MLKKLLQQAKLAARITIKIITHSPYRAFVLYARRQ
jgi:hypothetical protein